MWFLIFYIIMILAVFTVIYSMAYAERKENPFTTINTPLIILSSILWPMIVIASIVTIIMNIKEDNDE